MMKRQTSRRSRRATRPSSLGLALLWLAALFCAAAAEARAAADPPGTEPAITNGADDNDGDKARTNDDKADHKTDDNGGGDDNADAAQGTGGGGDEFHRWGFSLHAGASIPHPDFSDTRRPGPNFGIDLEYRFNKYFSLEAAYTFHRFGGERLGPFGPGQVFFELDDVNLHQFSLGGKLYAAGGNAPLRPFVNLGGGAYKFDPGPTRGGLNVGGGLQFDVTEKMAVEGAYNFHNVFGFSGDLRFSTVQAGVRFRF